MPQLDASASTSPTPLADPADQYVDDRQAAAILGLSAGYLRQLRLSGRGCRFARFGRAVRYRVGDLLEWAERHCVQSTSQTAGRSRTGGQLETDWGCAGARIGALRSCQ